MQGMIMHHAQAVEMTDLLRTRSHDPAMQALGKRMSISQSDEIEFMKRWLEDRGAPVSVASHMDMNHMDHSDLCMANSKVGTKSVGWRVLLRLSGCATSSSFCFI
jgi:uncharacterized protein (DUF305 family)